MFALALLWRIALAPGVALGLLEASAAQARLWHRRGRNHRPSRRGERGEKRDRAAARARRRTRTAGQQQGRAVVMELILLLIYSFFVWLIFFEFKWLPLEHRQPSHRRDHPDHRACDDQQRADERIQCAGATRGAARCAGQPGADHSRLDVHAAPRGAARADAHPFVPNLYQVRGTAEASTARADAAKRVAEAREAGNRSGQYLANTVLFATVLFFAGTAGKFEQPRVRLFSAAFGVALLVFAAIRMLLMPAS